MSSGAVTGVKMEHFSVLDPRKQELLEARIGGRVMDPPFFVPSDLEHVTESPRSGSTCSVSQVPAQATISGVQGSEKPVIGIGEQATSSSFLPKLEPSLYMGIRQPVLGSAIIQACVGGHVSTKLTSGQQYGTMQPGHTPYGSSTTVNSNRQIQSLPFTKSDASVSISEKHRVKLEPSENSGKDTPIKHELEWDKSIKHEQVLPYKEWDKSVKHEQVLPYKEWDKSVESENRNNKLAPSVNPLSRLPNSAVPGTPEEDCSKPINKKIQKLCNYSGTPDNSTRTVDLESPDDPDRQACKKTPKRRRHRSSPRGGRGSARVIGQVPRVGARADTPMYLTLEPGMHEKVRDAFTDKLLV